MEDTSQAPAVEGGSTSPSETNWVVITLGAIAIYLLFSKKKKKASSDEDKTAKIDSYTKFKATPMGSALHSELSNEGIELSANQIEKLDACLQGLTDEEYAIIEKASQFTKKEDLYKALSSEEMKVFLPVRKKILKCVDDVLNA
jgi:hypothetical protein